MREKIAPAFNIIAALLIWIIWCLPPLLQNNPAAFQAAGAIVICYGVYSYGRRRSSWEKSESASQNNITIAAINYIQTKIDLQDALSHNTADMNTVVYLRLLSTLGLEDRNVKDKKATILELEAGIADSKKTEDLHDKLTDQIEELNMLTKTHQDNQAASSKWGAIFGRLELWFVIIGTLQGAYGGKLVELVNSEFL